MKVRVCILAFNFFGIAIASGVLRQTPILAKVDLTDNLEWCWPWQLQHWTCPSTSTTTTTDYPESTNGANTSESTAEQTSTLQTDTSAQTFTSNRPESSTIYPSESTTVVSTTTEKFSSSTETFDSTTDESDPSTSDPRTTTTEEPDVDESLWFLRIIATITVVVIVAVCIFALYKSVEHFHYQRMPSNVDNSA